jgi:HEAT repeat protein
MKCILLTTLTIVILFIFNPILAQNVEFYNKVVRYGTDLDIAAAFNNVTEDLGQEVNEYVLTLLSEEHSVQVHMTLVRYIAAVNMTSAESTLIEQLHDGYSDEDYKETVIYAMGVTGSRLALNTLKAYYTNNQSTKRIKKAIIDAWGTIGNIEIESALIAILTDKREDDELKAAAILALGQVKSVRSLELLVEIASNRYENKYLRMYAVHSLGEIGGESMIDILGELVNDDTHEVAEYAVKSITQIDSEKSGEYLIQALRSDFDKVRYLAAIGLADQACVEAVEILSFKAEHDRNEKVRQEAKKALESIENANSL